MDALHAAQIDPQLVGEAVDLPGLADEHDARGPLLHHLGGRTQHPLVVPVGQHDARGFLPGASEDPPHGLAARSEARFQTVPVLLQVDVDAGGARIHRRLRHRRRHVQQHARIERLGDQVLGAELESVVAVRLHHRLGDFVAGQLGQGAGGRQHHPLVDPARPHVERAPEEEGEAEHVVHLIRVVRPPRGHDRVIAHPGHLLRGDLRVGVGQGEDDGIRRHRFDHRAVDQPLGRQADHNVRPLHRFCEGAQRALGGKLRLVVVHTILPPLVDHARPVRHDQVFGPDPEAEAMPRRGDRRRPRTDEHHRRLADVAPRDLKRIDQRRPPDDGSAVLVVVENGDAHRLAERLLDQEALGRADIFEIDAADGRLQHLAETDDLVRILRVDLYIEYVYPGEFLEEDALALHDRLGRHGPDVAESEDRRPVRNHRDQVPACSVAKDLFRVFVDGHAGFGHTRAVREGQISLGGDRLGGDHLDLPRAALRVIDQGVALECRQQTSPVFGGAAVAMPCRQFRDGILSAAAKARQRANPLTPCKL